MPGTLRITSDNSRTRDFDIVELAYRKHLAGAHRNAVKWLKRPNFRAEVKRALKRPDPYTLLAGPLRADMMRMQRAFAGPPPTAPHMMTEKERRAELGRQAKRLKGATT